METIDYTKKLLISTTDKERELIKAALDAARVCDCCKRDIKQYPEGDDTMELCEDCR